MNSATFRTAALAAAGVAALAGLSACEERPYSVPVRTAAAPAPRSPDLAGAPVAPPTAAPAPYIAPASGGVAVGPATPGVSTGANYASEPAPPATAYAPPPPPIYHPAPRYDTGGPMIVAMAPIANPPEHGYARHLRHTHETYAETTTTTGYVAPRHAAAAHQYGSAPYGSYGSGAVVGMTPVPNPGERHVAPAHHYAAAAPKAPAKPAVAAAAPVAKPAPKPVAVAAAPAPAKKPVTTTTVEKKVATTTKTVEAGAKTAAADTKVAAAKAVDAAKAAAPVAAAKVAEAAKKTTEAVKTAAAPTTATTPPAAGDRTTRLAALQAALTDAVSKNGVLTTPARFTANQPADVSLTLPAAFAETVRKEADKQQLSDAAASVNMTAVLAGDGFSVTPDDTQSQPLTVGQPTEFHWTVTAQPGAKGPLHADVGADLLGGGSDTLSLGTVQKNAGMQLKMTPRMLGAGILALIVILVLGWLARGRNTPSRSSAARRAGRRARGSGYNRPLDMSTDGDAHAH